MKRKYYIFYLLPVVVFMMVFNNNSLCGQTLEAKSRVNFMRIAKTSDVLYTNDSTCFLMDKSPLEKFQNYKKLYDRYKDKTIENVDVAYGSAIRPDGTTNYYIVWYLNDSLLYLSDINFFLILDGIETIFSNNEQYKLMEQLTGVKFDTIYENHTRNKYEETKYDRSKMPINVNPFGSMPATWFSDTIIVKLAKNRIDFHKWEKEPCRELIFKNGRLISDRVKEGMY